MSLILRKKVYLYWLKIESYLDTVSNISKIIEKHVEIYNNMENGELLDGTGDLYYNNKIKRK